MWNNTELYKEKNRNITPYLMIFPVYFIYIIFIFLPLIFRIGLSFTNYNFSDSFRFVKFDNYIKLLGDRTYLIALKNTVIYAVFTVSGQMLLGLILAVLVNLKGIYFKGFCRTVNYIPYVTSMAAISMVWLYLYEPTSNGILNTILITFNLKPLRWLNDIHWAMPSIILMSIWKSIGYNMIVYLAGLQQIPNELYEAAKVDGATGVYQFFKISVPLLNKTTVFLLVTTGIASFNVFEQVNILTDGGPVNATTTVVHQIYTRAFSTFQMGYASSMGVSLIIITLIFTFINLKYGSEDIY
jgi:multiple sugar transport system permease protein/raffinose/stachyose/melibiose transport system permease protein